MLLRARPPDPAAVRRGARRARARRAGPDRPAGRGQRGHRWRPGSATCSPRSAEWDDVALRLHVEDQAYSADLLRSGEVLAAVTSDAVAGAGLLGRAARRAPLPARGDPGVRRAVASRPGPRLGADAGGGVQREGRPPARRAPRPRRRPSRPWCTGCRRRPTSSRRSAWASAGRRSPSRSWTDPRRTPGAARRARARRRTPVLAAVAAGLARAGPPHRRGTPRRRTPPRRPK